MTWRRTLLRMTTQLPIQIMIRRRINSHKINTFLPSQQEGNAFKYPWSLNIIKLWKITKTMRKRKKKNSSFIQTAEKMKMKAQEATTSNETNHGFLRTTTIITSPPSPCNVHEAYVYEYQLTKWMTSPPNLTTWKCSRRFHALTFSSSYP